MTEAVTVIMSVFGEVLDLLLQPPMVYFVVIAVIGGLIGILKMFIK